jgi:integrase
MAGKSCSKRSHWILSDLVGKAGHVRTVPVPGWVKVAIDNWTSAQASKVSCVPSDKQSRPSLGKWLHLKVIWKLVRKAAASLNLPNLAPHDLRRSCARLCHLAGGEAEQIQFLLGHVSLQTTERYLGCKQNLRQAVNDRIGLESESD